MRRTAALAALLVAAVVPGVAGCGVSAAVKAAEARDFPLLARELDAAAKRGELDEDEARDVAEAVAEGEIEHAKGDEGVARVQGFQGCAEEVEDALETRSEGKDDVAAAAAGVLHAAGLVDEDEYADYALEADPRPAFRALGARSLVDEDHVELRRRLFVDLDERVRVGALRAANVLPSQGDFDALVEAARVDPNPMARSAAARALGRLGGERAVVALKDLWVRADGRLRESIVDAWIAPESYVVGGRDQLLRAAEEGGEGSVAAAIVLARVEVMDPRSKVSRDAAIGVLVRAMSEGTREDRTYALVMAPSLPQVLEAVRKAKDDTDPGIAIVALGRLLREGSEGEQKAARDKLLELAKTDDPEAPKALGELAQVGDQRAVQLLEKQLASKNKYARAHASRSLVLLGAYARAARSLADADADVRASVSCAILRED